MVPRLHRLLYRNFGLKFALKMRCRLLGAQQHSLPRVKGDVAEKEATKAADTFQDMKNIFGLAPTLKGSVVEVRKNDRVLKH